MTTTSTPRHAVLDSLPVAGHDLLVGGQPLTTLAQQVRSTPFYVYDRQLIDRRIALLRETLPNTLKLHYAVKANPMPELVAHLAGQVDGMDVASAGEIRLVVRAGMTPARISFTGPGKGDEELADAIEAGVVINVESVHELDRLARQAGLCGVRPQVTLRINPDFELKSSGMRMGGGARPFGIDAEQIPTALKRLASLDLDFRGFHIFSGSQSLNTQAIIQTQNATLALAVRLAAHAPGPIRHLNLGGGFGIPYFPGEQPLDLAPIGHNLHSLCEQAAGQIPEAELALELGRYLVGEAGIYVCRIIERKLSRGQVFLVTDGGLHHHLAASGNFGQVIRKNYPVVIGNRMSAGEDEQEMVSIVGRLCTPLDILAERMLLPKAEPGDLVAILQSGAYGLTASPTAFLGHPPPKEILL